MKISILNLEAKIDEVMSAVNRHERVTLTYRGRRYAFILPIRQKKIKASDLPAFGMWADRDDMKTPVTFVEKFRSIR